MNRPLVVLGALAAPVDVPTGVPVLAEPTSQGRLPGTITTYEALLRTPGWADAHRPTQVLRFGAVPTSRVLNEWLASLSVEHVVVDPLGLRRDPDRIATGFVERWDWPLEPEPGWTGSWLAAEAAARRALDGALAASLHEGAVVRALAAGLPSPANVFLGSSLPVRDADWFWPAAPGIRFFGNRGASGIDGLVSTGLGIAAASAEPTALLLGDLSLYHDMNGLSAMRRHGIKATLVILDNDGGGIFEFLPPRRLPEFEELFATPLGLDIGRVAALYGVEHRLVESVEALAPALTFDRPALVHVKFTRAASVAGHRAAWDAVAAALA